MALATVPAAPVGVPITTRSAPITASPGSVVVRSDDAKLASRGKAFPRGGNRRRSRRRARLAFHHLGERAVDQPDADHCNPAEPRPRVHRRQCVSSVMTVTNRSKTVDGRLVVFFPADREAKAIRKAVGGHGPRDNAVPLQKSAGIAEAVFSPASEGKPMSRKLAMLGWTLRPSPAIAWFICGSQRSLWAIGALLMIEIFQGCDAGDLRQGCSH